MEEEIDRLEGLSRRKNLRFFGVPMQDGEDCVQSVLDILNGEGIVRPLSRSDLQQARRVGPISKVRPRVMVVTFSQWEHKISIIKNQELRKRLREKGVRLSNDYTKKQTEIMAKARGEGKAAFFVKGKLIVRNGTHDGRSYAEVASVEVDKTYKEHISLSHDNSSPRYLDSKSCNSQSVDQPGNMGRVKPYVRNHDVNYGNNQSSVKQVSGKGSKSHHGNSGVPVVSKRMDKSRQVSSEKSADVSSAPGCTANNFFQSPSGGADRLSRAGVSRGGEAIISANRLRPSKGVGTQTGGAGQGRSGAAGNRGEEGMTSKEADTDRRRSLRSNNKQDK